MKKKYVILAISLGLLIIAGIVSTIYYLDYKSNQDRIERRAGELSVNQDLYNGLISGRDAMISQLKEKPDSFDILSELGVIYMTLGDFNNAINYLEQAAEVSPVNTKAWSNLASMYREQKKYNRARGVYEKFMRNVPKEPEPYVGLAEMYVAGQAGGTKEDAIAILEQGYIATKESPVIQDMLNKIKAQ